MFQNCLGKSVKNSKHSGFRNTIQAIFSLKKIVICIQKRVLKKTLFPVQFLRQRNVDPPHYPAYAAMSQCPPSYSDHLIKIEVIQVSLYRNFQILSKILIIPNCTVPNCHYTETILGLYFRYNEYSV